MNTITRLTILLWLLLVTFRVYDYYKIQIPAQELIEEKKQAEIEAKKAELKASVEEVKKPNFNPNWSGYENKKIRAKKLTSTKMGKSVSIIDKTRNSGT